MSKPHHVIIGAGISGLALGWFLKKRFGDSHTLTILESSERAGGWIRTSHDQGFLFEEGPRSCRIKGPGIDTLQLIEELGLCEEVIGASPQAKQRYIYLDGQLHSVPTSFFSFFFSPLMKGVLPALWKEWRTAPSNLEDESIADFIGRRFSPEIAEKLVDPLVSGIYAGDIGQLSIRSCFPGLHRMEQEHGSIIRGLLGKKKMEIRQLSPFIQALSKTPLFTFKSGMETLVKSLHNRLKRELRLSCKVESVGIRDGKIGVELQDGDRLEADLVFLAIPAHAAAHLLRKIDPNSAAMMDRETCASVVSVGMGWNRKVLGREGFGYLVPSSQKLEILGVVFDSSVFAEQNGHACQTRLTVMMGGAHRPGIGGLENEDIKKIALDAINRHLGIAESPDALHVSIANQAIPQYTLGHHARFLSAEESLGRASDSRIQLLGSAWRGVAVNDCICEAKEMAARSCN